MRKIIKKRQGVTVVVITYLISFNDFVKIKTTMTIETVEARLNAITNCIAVFDEVKQSIYLFGSNQADNKAHDWLYRDLVLLESKYKELLRLKSKKLK